jgi:hypothetical protein
MTAQSPSRALFVTGGNACKAGGAIPGGRRDCAAIGRDRKAGHRRVMADQNGGVARGFVRPESNAAILPARHRPPIRQERHRIDAAFVQPQDTFGRSGLDVPQDGRGVERPRQGLKAILRYRERADRAAMPPQIGHGRRRLTGKRKDEPGCGTAHHSPLLPASFAVPSP